MDERLSEALIDLPPQVVHINFDYIGAALFWQIPHLPEQGRSRDAAAFVLDQIFGEGIFPGAEIDFRPAPDDGASDAIEFQIRTAEHRIGNGLHPPSEGFDAHRKLAKRERFCNAVVRAKLEAVQPVFESRAATEYKDCVGSTRGAGRTENFGSVTARQVQIQKQEIKAALGDSGQSKITVAGNHNIVTFSFEMLPQNGDERWLIFHDQRTHV